jgi:transcriptional regulator with XRE-family HTH domain
VKYKITRWKVVKNISNLGVNIKRIRESKGISGYKLAKLAGLGKSTISQIETGDRHNLNSSTIIKIAEALGVSPQDLMFTEGEEEYVVNDFEDAVLTVLSSDELTIDSEKVTQSEKEIIEKYLSKAIDVIRIQRRDLR